MVPLACILGAAPGAGLFAAPHARAPGPGWKVEAR
jgi:hypothetical protein